MPTATIIVRLINPASPDRGDTVERLAGGGPDAGPAAPRLHASTERDLDTAFATLSHLKPGALVIATDTFFNSRTEQLAA